MISEMFGLKKTGIYAKYNLVKAQNIYFFYKRKPQRKIRTLDPLGRAASLRINSLLGSVA